MSDKSASDEFNYAAETIMRITKLLLDETEAGKLEACFVLGCLYNICYKNSLDFKEKSND